jgi:RNA polymerase-interacting CarD/CdnL/TRCF family regulator
MEKQTPTEFTPGTAVVYGMLGKCSVTSVENREINGETIRFYKLEVQKSALSRSTRQEPAIWIPVASARERGLRPVMTKEDAENVLSILSNREYYFPVNEPWSVTQPKLEACIRAEGSVGLAKVNSFLYVVKRRQIVPASEVTKFHESVNKLMLRELSDTLGEPVRVLEERINKGLRQKMIPDT